MKATVLFLGDRVDYRGRYAGRIVSIMTAGIRDFQESLATLDSGRTVPLPELAPAERESCNG